MNIGIDIDDTIANTYETVIPYAQKYTIEELHRSGVLDRSKEISTHKYTRCLHNWSDEEELVFWNKYYPKIVSELSVKSLASENIKKLSENNKIYLITARWDNEQKEISKITKKWLEENNIIYDELILNSENKAETAKKYDIKLFIDDSLSNCMQLTENGIKTFLMDSRVNVNLDNEKITRVYSWPHAYEEYLKITKGEN